ncbi:dihydroorotate dehydrogenase electron transfer subunit, partial [Treponema sp. OttesenSCG-928-L16]|nr:dihydroorotate dehydrogenase electron transfer subunit [Treponema sp. OttesenSCG-928-L16]
PLGKSWEDMPRPAEGQLALIGGGIGIAPLAAYAGELPKWEYDFYAGFKSSSYGLKGVQPKNLYIATEDGCEGCRGRIPDLLDPAKYGAVYACGPEPMLRAVAGACKKAEVPCFISMEKRMACGAGACLGCTVETTQGNKRCCADGPVFSAEEIIFND